MILAGGAAPRPVLTHAALLQRAPLGWLLERGQRALGRLPQLLCIRGVEYEACAGLLRQMHGDNDPCVQEAYTLVLAVDPQNAYAQVERADVLRACGRYEEARDVYARCQSPDFCEDVALRVEAAFKLGCVALVLQENSLAHDSFRAVIAADPDYPDAHEMLALVSINS